MLIGEGTQEVQNGKLAEFDPSTLSNDPYAVIVAAYDVNGLGYIQPTVYYVEGNVLLGNFELEFTDLTIPLAGIPIQITRRYDTLDAQEEHDFGHGWSVGAMNARILEVANVGQGGANNSGNDKFVPDVTKVYLTNPEGRRVGFTYREEPRGSLFGVLSRPYFQPDPGVYDTLEIDVKEVGRGGIVGAFRQGVNPDAYTLTTPDGTNYRYADTGEIQYIEDLNGNRLDFSEGGVTHNRSDATVQFIRDHRGRIKEIRDPDGNTLKYFYDTNHDLVGFEDQEGLRTEYTYLGDDLAHILDEAFRVLPDGTRRRVFKAEYDEEGMFRGLFDVNGNRIDGREYQLADRTAIIRDANGNATTLIYDDRGNVTDERDAFFIPSLPDEHVTRRYYEDERNPDLETKIIDRNGNVTTREYDKYGNLKVLTELGHQDNPLDEPRETRFTYDSGNRVTSITNARKYTTLFDYDSKGNLRKITNALGDSSSFTYDDEGRRKTFTDFNGNTTTFDYTGRGDQPTRVTFADDTYQELTYNGYGQVTSEKYYEADGTLVEVTSTTFDRLGRALVEIRGDKTLGQGQYVETHNIYDGHLLDYQVIVHPESLNASEHLLESPATPVQHRKSRITDFAYDVYDRLIQQIDAEAWFNPETERFEDRHGIARGVIEFRYDAQGNRVLLRDPVGNITTWVYDKLNRAVEERDPFFNEKSTITQALDAPNSLSDADPSNNIGAEHVTVTTYDAEGNRSKVIDRIGRRREFDYDAAGRLLEERWYNGPDHISAPQSLVEAITFTYDATGNMLTAADSSSDYFFAYDQLNTSRR